ncbi:MAG: hypothetical protein MI919_10785 [Holophagales bacterium]|nr:hypothetical protein [Holophagales bacterium]
MKELPASVSRKPTVESVRRASLGPAGPAFETPRTVPEELGAARREAAAAYLRAKRLGHRPGSYRVQRFVLDSGLKESRQISKGNTVMSADTKQEVRDKAGELDLDGAAAHLFRGELDGNTPKGYHSKADGGAAVLEGHGEKVYFQDGNLTKKANKGPYQQRVWARNDHAKTKNGGSSFFPDQAGSKDATRNVVLTAIAYAFTRQSRTVGPGHIWEGLKVKKIGQDDPTYVPDGGAPLD